MKRNTVLALLLVLVMAFGVVASASAYTYDTILNPNAGGDLSMTLTNLDLDGSLTEGMFEGRKIVVAVSSGNFIYSNELLAEVFSDITGAEVEIQSNPDDLFTKIQMGLSTGGMYDVICMPIAYIHSFAYADYIADITPMIAEYASPTFNTDDFIPGLFSTYAKYGDQLIAFPFKPDTQMFFYRKDLFEDETIKAQFYEMYGTELVVPTTNEALLRTAQFFTKSINPDSPVDYGFSTMMSKGNSRFSWFNRLGEYGGSEIKDGFELGFTDGSGVEALEFMLELQKCAPADWLSFDWDTANTFFCQGNAAMMEQWPYLGTLAEMEGSVVAGKVAAAVTPGGSPTLGGWALAIVKDTQDPELAFKFCEFATSADGECLKIQYEMDPCRTANYSRDVVKDFSDKYEAFMQNLAVATQLADTDIPYISAECGDIEEIAVQAALSGELTAQEAIDQMAEQLKKVIDEFKEDEGL